MLLTDIIINCAEADCPFYGVCKVAQFPDGSHAPIVESRWNPTECALSAVCESHERIAGALTA